MSNNAQPTNMQPDVGTFLQQLMTLNWQGKKENSGYYIRGENEKHEAECGLQGWVPEAVRGRYYHHVHNHEAESGLRDHNLKKKAHYKGPKNFLGNNYFVRSFPLGPERCGELERNYDNPNILVGKYSK